MTTIPQESTPAPQTPTGLASLEQLHARSLSQAEQRVLTVKKGLQPCLAKAEELAKEFAAIVDADGAYLERVAGMDMARFRGIVGFNKLGNVAAEATRLREDLRVGYQQLTGLRGRVDGITTKSLEVMGPTQYAEIVGDWRSRLEHVKDRIRELKRRIAAFTAEHAD